MKKYAVITGASAGLGMEFAKRLAEKKYRLILIARREERLQELANSLDTECKVIAADLTKEETCFQVWEQICDKPIMVFINNAGFGYCGDFEKIDVDCELNMIQLNIKAVHIFTKLALRKMQKQDKGYILNVASCSGLMPGGPYMATYYATKSYVVSFTKGIAEELRRKRSNVYIGCLCPGPVHTEFDEVARVKFSLPSIGSKECVNYALKQMSKRKTMIIPTIWLKELLFFGKYLPDTLYVRIVAKQQKVKEEK